MSDLSFVPWVRHRLAQLAEVPVPSSPAPTPAAPPARPVINVRVHLTADTTPVEAVRPVQLYGPGDVSGLQPEAVIRTLPVAGEQQYPANLLAAVEFYDEELPWRFSLPPAAATPDRVTPWCFLLVLREDEYTLRPQQDNLLPVIEVARPHEVLPASRESLWAWAHMQANEALSDQIVAPADAQATRTFLNEALRANPDLALSRLLSPRRLAPNTAYRACLVPTYEVGRRAGLGLPAGETTLQQLAWLTAADAPYTDNDPPLPLPVYYQWEFRTGAGGDFESLARLLQPGNPAGLLGRSFDVTVPAAAGTAVQYALPMPTALRPLGPPPAANAAVSQYLLTQLAPAAAPLLRPTTGYRRPVVTAPVYGRYYHPTGAQLAPRTADWKDTANLDVRYRALTGLGAQAVQDNQEELLRRAWEQVSEILVANTHLRGMQAGLHTTTALRDRHLPVAPLPAAVAARAVGGQTPPLVGGTTLDNYALHLAGLALTPAFRRIAKPFGRYQESQAGPHRRPSLPEAPLSDEQRATLQGTSLRQRDGLLAWIADGTITAAPAKEPFALLYQFDDSVIDVQLKSREWTGAQSFMRDTTTITLPPPPPDKPAEHVIHRFRLNPLTGDPIQFQPPPVEGTSLNLESLKQALLTGTDPRPAFLARAKRALRLVPHYPAAGPQSTEPQQRVAGPGTPAPVTVAPVAFALTKLQPVMAYPVFKDATGDWLRRKRPDLFMPGLDKLAENTLVALVPDPAFVEAYLLGLNHALGNELLWRNYPTDLRGSYFRQFWDVREQRDLAGTADPAVDEETGRDVKPLDEWSGALGTNQTATDATDRLLLVVRADLLRRFPGTVVCAQPVQIGIQPIVPNTTQTLYPTKRMEIGQDVVMFEFALSEAAALGDPDQEDSGYFFVFMERPGEAQFGLDDPAEDSNLRDWSDLFWDEDLLEPTTGNLRITATAPALPADSAFTAFTTLGDAAQVAYALYQKPFAIAIHARELLPGA